MSDLNKPLEMHANELSYSGINLKGLLDSGKKASAAAAAAAARRRSAWHCLRCPHGRGGDRARVRSRQDSRCRQGGMRCTCFLGKLWRRRSIKRAAGDPYGNQGPHARPAARLT